MRRLLVKREVMQQACLLFAKQGFDGTNLAHIADAVGVTRGAIYYYYKSKEALLEAIVQEVTFSPVEEMERWKASVTHTTAADRMRSFIRMRVRNVLQHRIELRIIDGTEASLPPALLERHVAAKRKILAEYRALIRAGIAAGEFRPVNDRVAALGLIGMVNWTTQWFKPEQALSDADVADQIADLAVASVLLDAQTRSELKTPDAVVASMRHDLDHLSRLLGAHPSDRAEPAEEQPQG